MSKIAVHNKKKRNLERQCDIPTEDAYRIYIDGACKNNNRPVEERYAGYGIYVDKLSNPHPVELGDIDDQVDAQLTTKSVKETTVKPAAEGAAEVLFFVSETCVCSEPTNNRSELMAAIRCLELLLDGRFGATKESNVTIVNDSKLVFETVTDYLPRLWRPNNYRKGNGEPVANEDLVRRLDAAVLAAQRRGWKRLHWQHMNSHRKQPKDHTSNEWCDWNGNDQADRLANVACKKLQKKRQNQQ